MNELKKYTEVWKRFKETPYYEFVTAYAKVLYPFYDVYGHHVRLIYHSAINTCCVLIRRLATLIEIVNRGYTRSIKHTMEESIKIWACFPQGFYGTF